MASLSTYPVVAPGLARCIPAREVVLRFRNRRTHKVRSESVVCPIKWTRGRLLTYARRCHPDETVRIEDWKPVGKPENAWQNEDELTTNSFGEMVQAAMKGNTVVIHANGDPAVVMLGMAAFRRLMELADYPEAI